MFHNRPCGCKGQRSCLQCEAENGAWRINSDLNEQQKTESLIYCPLCGVAWPGFDGESWQSHPHHQGDCVRVPGIFLQLNFVTPEEEADLLRHIDEVPWDVSQSGRRKQNFGPKCNFKRRKVKLDGFIGFPAFTKYIQDRFRDIPLLHDFQTVEQCSLDYTTSRGASIDPHVDDCWIWGERIPTLSLMSDTVLTLTRYVGNLARYNLKDVQTYPAVVDQCRVKTIDELTCFYDQTHNRNNHEENFGAFKMPDSESPFPKVIRVPLPRRSLVVLYGTLRYGYEHSILRDDLASRRVCITYRELTPTYRSCGPLAPVGQQILLAARQFWNHKERYAVAVEKLTDDG